MIMNVIRTGMSSVMMALNSFVALCFLSWRPEIKCKIHFCGLALKHNKNIKVPAFPLSWAIEPISISFKFPELERMLSKTNADSKLT